MKADDKPPNEKPQDENITMPIHRKAAVLLL